MIDVAGTLKRGWHGLIAPIDFPLLLITLSIMAVGLATIHSATFDGNNRLLSQAGNMGVAMVVMWLVARLPPQKLDCFCWLPSSCSESRSMAPSAGCRWASRASSRRRS